MVVAEEASHAERIVLCIEDDDSLGQLLVLMLRRVPDLRVVLVGTRRDALQAVATTRCDVVLTDLNLPDAEGAAWVSELVGLPALLEVPVVAMSAGAAARTIDAVRQSGAVDFLPKPVARDRLIALVTDLCGSSPHDRDAASPVTDLRPPATLMDRCLSESALDLEHLHVEIAARNGQQVDWLCHRLMGRAMMYGMVELSEVLQRLDTTFRLDQPEMADALVDGADRALERFRQDLSS